MGVQCAHTHTRGLRSKRPTSCDPVKHRKRILCSDEVHCLVSKGFGVVDGNIAVWDDRLLFAAGKTIKRALLTAAVATAAAASPVPQHVLNQSGNNSITALHENKLDSYHHLPPAARPAKFSVTAEGERHRRQVGGDLSTWRDIDLQASAAYMRPFSDQDLPVPMRSEPLQTILPYLPKVERFEFDPGRIYKLCSGVVLPQFNICVIAPVKASVEKSRFLVGKVAMLFGMLTYKMPPISRKLPLTVIVESGKGSNVAQKNSNIIWVGEDQIMSSDRSNGVLLHELAHIVEDNMPSSMRQRIHELYLASLPKLKGMAGVVAHDSKPRDPDPTYDRTFLYATKESEFFTTACESWFNAVPAWLLTPRSSMRVTRNRSDLWTLFPEVAIFLSTFLAPYSYDNKEVDQAVMNWQKNLPQHELQKIDQFHAIKSSGNYVDGIINRGVYKVIEVLQHVGSYLEDDFDSVTTAKSAKPHKKMARGAQPRSPHVRVAT